MSDLTVEIPRRMVEVDGKDRPLEEHRFIEALWKTVCGYWNGFTMQHFMVELGFAEWREDKGKGITSTDFGRKFLYHYYNPKCAKSKFIFLE
jgi:hypothetical protein